MAMFLLAESFFLLKTSISMGFVFDTMNEWANREKPLNLLFITSFKVKNYVSSYFNSCECMTDYERRKKTVARCPTVSDDRIQDAIRKHGKLRTMLECT